MLKKPTKENFLKLIDDRIEEYEKLKEECDWEKNPGAKGALLELKHIKQRVSVFFEEGKEN